MVSDGVAAGSASAARSSSGPPDAATVRRPSAARTRAARIGRHASPTPTSPSAAAVASQTSRSVAVLASPPAARRLPDRREDERGDRTAGHGRGDRSRGGRAARQPDGDEQRQRHLGRRRRARRPARRANQPRRVGVDEQEVVRAGEAAGGGRIEDERDRHAEEEVVAYPSATAARSRRRTSRSSGYSEGGMRGGRRARGRRRPAQREEDRAPLGLRQRVQREPGCGEQERASQRPRGPDGPGDECERGRALERDRPGGVAARRQVGALAHLCQARHDERDGSGDGERAADHASDRRTVGCSGPATGRMIGARPGEDRGVPNVE